MSNHQIFGFRFSRILSVFLVLTLLIPPPSTVQAADDITTLIKQFETSMKAVEGGSREAALKLLPVYQEYKHLINAEGNKFSRETVKALDNQIINMCQEAWRDVSLKPGSGLSYIVPVGTLGTRETNPAYMPGKSDKDFIPHGSKASQAVEDFNKVFQEKFNVKPEIVDVNALDPTKIETWPDRVLAAKNVEKYNTKGGINWLENKLYEDKPNLWRYDTLSDAVGEVSFNEMVKNAPPPMKWDDALGFASDNLRFREGLLLDKKLSNAEKALKTSKYDLRTLEAFELAGGKLSAREKELIELTKIFREPPGGTLDSALKAVTERTGMSADDALRYYLNGMEKLNADMTQSIAANYLTKMGLEKSSTIIREELAASLGNMPSRYTKEVESMASKYLGGKEYKEIQKLAEAFRGEVGKARYGLVYFNEKSMEMFGKSYDKLDDAQRAALHGANEAAESFASKSFKVLGYTIGGLFIGYAIYSAYHEGNQEGGSLSGLISGGKRAFIELLEWGYPPAVAVEIISSIGAGVFNLGMSAYKNDVLDSLYKMYKDGENIDIILNTYGVQHYNSLPMIEMANEIRAEHPDMSDAEINEAIKTYFVNRLRIENEQEGNKKISDDLISFLKENHIQLSAEYSNNSDFEHENPEDYYKAVANWLKWADVIREQLKDAGINLSTKEVHFLVNRFLNRGHADYVKAMKDIFRTYGKTYPPAKAKKTAAAALPCSGIACLKLGAYATIKPKTIPPNPGTIWSGGGSFKEKAVDQPCDPAQEFGPFEVSGGATAVAAIDGNPPVPNVWSLFNANSSLHITFKPKTGATFGMGEYLVGLAGQVGNSHLSQEFDIPGPGLLSIAVVAPRGGGPLSGACFGQGYSASIKVLKMKEESSARSGTVFGSGDRVTSAGSPVIMVMEDGTKLEVFPYSTASFDRDANGRPVVRLEKGRIQFTSPKQGGKPIVVQVGNTTTIRKGTKFIARNDADYQSISVGEGSVTVSGIGNGNIEVGSGKEINLATGDVYDFEYVDDNRYRMHNLRIDDLFLGDAAPEPAGTVSGPTAASPMDGGWIWQDPGYETKLEVTNGQVKMTVPHGKCAGVYCDNSPVLMHKVSGDFDLQTTALLQGPNDRWVEMDFILYAPDSFIGLNSKQATEDSLLTHTRMVGAGWSRVWGRSMLKNMNQSFQYGGKEIPDKPVQLKLTRRGDLFRSYWSLDNGSTWNLSAHEQIAVPETLYTGWLSIYGGDTPGDPAKSALTLSNIKLTSAPLNSLPNPDWDYVYRQGVASGSGDSIELKLDGSALGDVTAYRSEVLPGDFEIIASYEAEPWQHQQGQSRGFSLMAETIDGNKVAYVGAFQNDYNKYQFQTNFNIGGVVRGGWEKMEGAGFTGRLKLARVGSVIHAYVELDGEWVLIDKGYADQVSEPVMTGVQVFNNQESTTPSAVKANFAIEQITGVPEIKVSATETGEQPAAEEEISIPQEQSSVESNAAESFGEIETEEKPANLVYQDDFSQNSPAWKVVSGAQNGQVVRATGVMGFTITQPGKYLSVEVPWGFDEPVQDVSLAMKAKVQTPNLGGFGFFCRVKDSKNFDMVMIQTNAQGGGFYRISKGKDGKTIHLTEWKQSNAFYGGEIEEQIEFDCIGDKLTLKTNGKLLDEVVDSDINSGGAVVYAVSFDKVTAANPFKITVDDFRAEAVMP